MTVRLVPMPPTMKRWHVWMICSRKAAAPVENEARVNVLDESVGQPQLRFRTEKSDYERSVEEAKRHIIDGDVFQVVISQRLDIDSPADSV